MADSAAPLHVEVDRPIRSRGRNLPRRSRRHDRGHSEREAEGATEPLPGLSDDILVDPIGGGFGEHQHRGQFHAGAAADLTGQNFGPALTSRYAHRELWVIYH